MSAFRFLSVATVLLILSGSGALLRAQSLADVAKKEEERRKVKKLGLGAGLISVGAIVAICAEASADHRASSAASARRRIIVGS